ncbi:hypothetical protein DEO72_LG3g3618 [Vigna unguiculata]|uniref:Uncharacterized protein n=1 Tax=Vigna unguiculata TaxID=3917 RepID=A0A4D6LKL6_VIGUN|nr:hypothetical protein DEO72_LG3g3618 [Vigna unguiculata]
MFNIALVNKPLEVLIRRTIGTILSKWLPPTKEGGRRVRKALPTPKASSSG